MITRVSPELVSITWLFICKFVFNVQWNLDFKKSYYVYFYIGSDVQM
jgi:hypothetical protein